MIFTCQVPSTNLNKVNNHKAVTSYRITTVIKPPFIFINETTGEWSGYFIDVIKDIARDTNFEYEIKEVADKDYGFLHEDGSWNGMVKELMDKKADIALGGLTLMAERENVIDFTVPYYDLVGISILVQKPRTSTSLFRFLTVLENEVWMCIFLSYLFTSFVIWVFDRLSPYSYQNNLEMFEGCEEKRIFNVREALWFTMTSLTPQGGGEAPRNLSGRLVAAIWWMFGFVIVASYTANLAAFLTISRLETPIDTLEDLSHQYRIQYSCIKNSEPYFYFDRMARIEQKFYK